MAGRTKVTKMQDEMKLKLVRLLKNMFYFEDQDLDFGIYKIMNQKRDEIKNYIEKDLVEKIAEQLELVTQEKKDEISQELGELKGKVIDAYGKDAFVNGDLKDEFKKFDLGKRYTAKLKEMKSIEVSKDLEREIYNHIYTFFSRYYDKGDFLSQRRYSHQGNERYAIPYDGEEVLLHWANKNQYYIKTTRNFKKYVFTANGTNVYFRIASLKEEKGNVKADEKLYFILHEEKPYDSEDNSLSIYFEYRPLKDEEKKEATFGKKAQINQNDINTYTFEYLKKKLEKENPNLFKTKKGKTTLERNLYKYTACNTSDFFIHKDLETFLMRELDFYLKNEVLKLEKLEREEFQKRLLKAKVIRGISEDVINFLSQLENFQKKLWDKKKFILSTDYMMTLDCIDEKYYDQILENENQLKEWKSLFNFDLNEEIKKLDTTTREESSAKKQVLRNNPTLVVDTKFFGNEFKEQLLGEIENLDSEIRGILLKSENFQALNLLSNKYNNKIKYCYIDPPFNSKSTEIIYKNTFKHSSWLSLMANRFDILKEMLIKNRGVLTVAIDENEQERLGLLLTQFFPDFKKTCVVVVHNPAGTQGKNFSYTHEYAYFVFPQNGQFIAETERENTLISSFRDWGNESERNNAKNCFYPIIIKDDEIIGFGNVCSDEFHPSSSNVEQEDSSIFVYPIDQHDIERKWVFNRENVEKIKDQLFVKKNDPEYVIMRKKSSFNYRTVWTDKRYYANVHGSKLLGNMIPNNTFTFPKSVYTVKDSIGATTKHDKQATIIDYFAGSGTTGHAVLMLNKEDNGNRKFILVEMGDYFDTVLKPRIEKAIFSDKWRNGIPQNKNGSPKQIIKYHSVEQYEDALENIEFGQKTIPEYSDYLMKYMLDFETKDSNTFLNIDKIDDPFNYKLRVLETVGTPAKTFSVDLVETFNYLLGLEVEKFKVITCNGRKYVFVSGKAADGQKTLVIWRPLKDLDFENDKKTIEKIVDDLGVDEVYINGDAGVKDFTQIESKFKALLWD
jgi:adenine-specific DNA-methyltransferase